MAQKTILSFFKSFGPDSSKELKRAPSKVSESVIKDSFETKCIIEDSPIKRKKRKIKCIESDDEPDTIKALTSSSKIDEQEEMKDCQSTKRKSKENIQKELHGETSSKKSPKVKKIKNGENEKSSELPIKMETNGKDDCKDELSEIDNILLNSQSTSTGMDSSLVSKDVEVIPKRKTARKQFNSVKKVETNIIKDGNNSKFGIEEQNNNEIATKCSLLNDELNSNEKDFKNDNEMVLSNHSQLLHSNTNLSENEKLPKIQESSKNVLSDFIKEESSSKTDTESLSNAKTKGTLKKSAKKVSIQSKRSNPSTKETENELSGSENNFNSDINCGTEILDDSKKPSNVKHKSRNKSTKEILLKKENSIHSFFAPLKKMKDNTIDEKHSIENEIDNNEKDVNKNHQKENVNTTLEDNQNASVDQEKVDIEREMENIPLEIDSPVKKLSKSRKVHSLDSEDEKLEAAKMAVNIKSEKIKNDSLTSLEELKTTSKNNEDIFESSKKTEILLDSKTHKENQKLSIKSTSSDTVYDPSKIQYHPIKDAFWKENEKTPYLALAKTLELIENTSGRLKIIEILSNFFRSVIILSPDDFLQSVYLCLNRLAPEYEGIELGVGETLLMKVVAQATGRTLQQIKSEVAVKGDLGLVSESSRGNQRVMFAPPKLSVSLVFNKFLEIAKMSGNAAMVKKIDKIQSLFVACRDCEAKYIIRSLSGKLRIGLAEQSVLTAIARAVVLTPPGQSYPPEIIDASKKKSEKSFKEILDSETMILKTVYCECPNYDLIIPVLLKEGISALPKCCQLSPGRPLKPMLAHPTAGIDIILQRFDKNPFTCEFKYDGERAQIHMTEDGEVKIFSRNQEDNTSKYPDVISRISKALESTTKSFILDSEAVAWDKETKQILPFQVLSTRKKKDAVESEIKVQVCIMAFDLLYLNGKSLVKEPLKERRSLLHSAFREVEDEFMFAQYRDGNSPEAMQEFLDESVKGNCEGLMVKALEIDASYEIAKRSHNWLKLKKDYLQGIGDTLDLVVIGGYYGKGKRAGNYGGFLLACYDEDSEEFQSICKLGTGFKDDVLEAHTAFLKQHTLDIPKPYYRFDHTLEPDVWFKPVQVWEIKCADMSISPVHKAAIGIVDPEKGISLRFPRFIRTRDDKTAENATSSVQIANMYQKQEQIQNTSNKNAKVEEDFY